MQPRLIALLVCEDVVDLQDGSDRTSVIGIALRALQASFPSSVPMVVYAAYAGVFQNHELKLDIIDVNTRQSVGRAITESTNVADSAPMMDHIFRFNLNVAQPANYALHLLVDGIDIGWVNFSVSQA
jgi:hypothetical protein